MANRGWPDAEKLRARAEKAISLDSYDPARTLAYFQSYPPQTASGQLRYAPALNAAGRREHANAAVRRAWTSGPPGDSETTPPSSMTSDKRRGGEEWGRRSRTR